MDVATIVGLFLGIGGILVGQVLEGGHLSSIIQGTAAIIVFGGTIGAVMVGTPLPALRLGLQLLGSAFKDVEEGRLERIRDEIVASAQTARKDSILALEKQVNKYSHPYMRQVFKYVIDGIEPATIEEVFNEEIMQEEERMNAGAKIFIDAGGYAPTIGIIGAVMGLIHVMANLRDTSNLGAGIAVAFVATIYGVASANLIFLPIGNKIKARIRAESNVKEMILAGAVGIVKGYNPYIINEKLNAYIEKEQGENG
jgi:chemotaxis protein MotA